MAAGQADRGLTRRSFLTIAASAVGACGAGLAAIPFVRSMSPSSDVIAAGVVEVDVSKIAAGALEVVLWRRQPVFILRRTPAMIEAAGRIDGASLRDPASPAERVKRPEWLVCLGVCTHLGCIPMLEPGRVPGLDQPGFFCPCHGGKYDTLGRRLDGPPPENLHLLPYEFTGASTLRIGSGSFSGFDAGVRKLADLPAGPA
ncbi:MAG TPA: ubiquinol-cytochrome c reductase iron-sulfur subunit [bacterium]